MWIGPPKALDWPKPMSSISTISTLGALAGALTSNRGGALALRASSVVIGASFGSGIGRTVRSRLSAASSRVADAVGFPAKGPTAAIQPKRTLIPSKAGTRTLAMLDMTASFRRTIDELGER